MDNKINEFHKKIVFDLFKNIIIEQNKLLLSKVAEVTGIDEKYLNETYLKPAYYLPIITKSQQQDKK
jgi:hypothetical protein